MDKIVKFIECLVPVTACNLECEYCYVSSQAKEESRLPNFRYTSEEIGNAFSQERLGGVAFVNFAGAGETLIPKEITDIIFNILKQGHYVNITNNGTITKRIDEILQFPKEYLSRILFSFSFHYTELKRKKLLDIFFNNVVKVHEAGCSIFFQMNLCDDYIDHIEEIKTLCKSKLGTLPHVLPTRKLCEGKFELYTEDVDRYIRIAREFNSEIFEFGLSNMNVKRKEFCYAGIWSFTLNLESGILKSCYAYSGNTINFYEDCGAIEFKQPVGFNCCSPYCINSVHFLALGSIPKIQCKSYAEYRNKTDGSFEWFNGRMFSFLNQKLYEVNDVCKVQELIIYKFKNILSVSKKKIKKILKCILPIQQYRKVKNKIKLQLDKIIFIQKVKKQLRIVRKENKYVNFLFATPCHGNLGDHAIVRAEKKMLTDIEEKSIFVEISNDDYRKYKKCINKIVDIEDTIIIDGGGNLGTLWQYEDNKISEIISTYKNNKIIIFPQTCFYDNTIEGNDVLSKNQEIYSKARDLTICLRDKVSYDSCQEYFSDVNLLLTPDIVMYLDNLHYDEIRKGCLLCLRSDKEKVLEDEFSLQIEEYLNNIGLEFRYTDTVIKKRVDSVNRNEELDEKWKEFASAKLVITDRLHGMIFAAITGTPCLAIDNISKKVSGVYGWIKYLDYIKVCDSVEEIIDNIDEFSSMENCRYSKDEHSKYFEQIEELFK